jgi:hypothetical protein
MKDRDCGSDTCSMMSTMAMGIAIQKFIRVPTQKELYILCAVRRHWTLFVHPSVYSIRSQCPPICRINRHPPTIVGTYHTNAPGVGRGVLS